MKELAQALKQRAGLRRRQGVVTAVDGATCTVLIGGSTVPVEGVQHLNSCAPQIDDVVWLDVDGADLWIIGTHGPFAGLPVISVEEAAQTHCTYVDVYYPVAWIAPLADLWGMWDAANPTRLTFPTAGLWLLGAQVGWTANAAAGYVKATFASGPSNIEVLTSTYWAQAAYDTIQNLGGVVRFAAGDYVELCVANGKGAGQTTLVAPVVVASAVWLGA